MQVCHSLTILIEQKNLRSKVQQISESKLLESLKFTLLVLYSISFTCGDFKIAQNRTFSHKLMAMIVVHMYQVLLSNLFML